MVEPYYRSTRNLLRATGIYVTKKWLLYLLESNLVGGELVGAYRTRAEATGAAKRKAQADDGTYAIVNAEYIYQPARGLKP